MSPQPRPVAPLACQILPGAPRGVRRTTALPLHSPTLRERGPENELGSWSFLLLWDEDASFPEALRHSHSTQSGARCLVKSVPRLEHQAFCSSHLTTPRWNKKELKTKTEGFLEGSGFGGRADNRRFWFQRPAFRKASLHWAIVGQGALFPCGRLRAWL